MKKIQIKVKNHSYPIYWINSIERIRDNLIKTIKNRKVFIITNQTISGLYKDHIQQIFPNSEIITLKDGEIYKNLTIIESIVNDLLKYNADRNSLLVAFGGGVIGDITGFVASIYMRGIEFIQIPTTLLAMVDSSVGGKTGVNSKYGKNMIGTFSQPKVVVICSEFLKTLPIREIRSGLAEAIKSALLKDKLFFKYLITHTQEILSLNLNIFQEISYSSVKIKSWVVQKDEKELWLRGILNLGHTLAHAIENYFSYEKIQHGEAVSIGLNFAMFYAFKKKYIQEKEFMAVNNLLLNLNLPRKIEDVIRDTPIPNINELVERMKLDKKNKNGTIYYIFIKKIGKYKLPEKVESTEVIQTLEEYFKQC